MDFCSQETGWYTVCHNPFSFPALRCWKGKKSYFRQSSLGNFELISWEENSHQSLIYMICKSERGQQDSDKIQVLPHFYVLPSLILNQRTLKKLKSVSHKCTEMTKIGGRRSSGCFMLLVVNIAENQVQLHNGKTMIKCHIFTSSRLKALILYTTY